MVMPGTRTKPPDPHVSTTDALVEELRRHAATIDQNPFGRVELNWQDGRPVLVELTTRHKPAN